ncbi:MAG: hypothetical protein ABI619_12410 [Betaproteobacteria bacterium]
MQPDSVFEGAEETDFQSAGPRPKADEVTARGFFAAMAARLRTIFAAKCSSDTIEEPVLGEQVELPKAFVKETRAVTLKDGRG